MVKNVLSDPAPGFPIFYFPPFIFSAAGLIDSAPSVLFVADRRREVRGERRGLIGHGSSVIGHRSDSEFSDFLLSPFHLFLPPFASLRALRG